MSCNDANVCLKLLRRLARPSRPIRDRGGGAAGGFSLVEIMVVLVIIGMLAGAVTISVRQYLISAKQNTARLEIATLANALETFFTVYDRYPTNDEGIEVLTRASERMAEPLVKQEPIDPWGRRYEYLVPGRNAPFEVICFGADGREGGDGADRDISSSELKQATNKDAI